MNLTYKDANDASSETWEVLDDLERIVKNAKEWYERVNLFNNTLVWWLQNKGDISIRNYQILREKMCSTDMEVMEVFKMVLN